MSNQRAVRVSKFLSLVLRHEPGKIGITLDAAGWVGVDELLAACKVHGFEIAREELESVVAGSDKQRFAFSEDGRQIRANQGHSVQVELGYKPADPPDLLYHGTAEKSVAGIRRSGLLKQARHHVHLSQTIQTATAVGTRHGKLVLLTVRAGAMHAAGHAFFLTPNGVWLTDNVPPEFLEFPSYGKSIESAPSVCPVP